MVNIYKITDCNGRIYIGSTKSTVAARLCNHLYEKRKARTYYSSHKLDLENCEIEVIEECEPEIRYEREKYHIQNTECVNIVKFNCMDKKEYYKQWRENNKEHKMLYTKEWRKNNKETVKAYREIHKKQQKQYHKQYTEKNKDKINVYQKQLREYKRSWGDMLKIDVDLFTQ